MVWGLSGQGVRMNFLPPIFSGARRDFLQNGYVALPQALPAGLTEQWREKSGQLRDGSLMIKRSEGGFELVYRVVTGEVIQAQWPELFAFYKDSQVLEWISNISGENEICTSSSLRSAVNLNIMESTDSVYRWHFDAVPYTMLIYLNDIAATDGGAMEMVPDCRPHRAPDLTRSHIVQLWPRAGTVVLMDGTRCYHHVSQLLRPYTRLSIPLVYPNSKEVDRPAGLDAYLYRESDIPDATSAAKGSFKNTSKH